MDKPFPRVLVFGQTFNDFSGGGITLTSLFSGWPKHNLAVISYPFMLHNSSTKVCDNLYQIGREELSWHFPLSRIKQNFPSGRLVVTKSTKVPVLKGTQSFRNILSARIVNPFLKWSGLVHTVSSIHLSNKLKKWMADFSPDVLYLQIANRESINFAGELIEYLKIPAVIHMMDDWPSTISSRGLFRRYWEKRIDQEFRWLLAKTELHLSISDAMTVEYQKRYGHTFRAFHNAIDPGTFLVKTPINRDNDGKFRILYIGRIGTANKRALLRFSTFLSKYEPPEKISVEFDIYTKDTNSPYASKLIRLKRIAIKEAIQHSEIPCLLKTYDLLLLPLDFSDSGLRFSRLSMPTKASEYMMSGTPMLVLAPAETAISQFCSKNECGHCVASLKKEKLAESLKQIIRDTGYRQRLADRAREVAMQLFNVHTVREEFRALFTELRLAGPLADSST